jgi:hypothetical protein
MSLEMLFAGGHSQVKVASQKKPVRLGKSGAPVVVPPSRYHPEAARLLTQSWR